MTVTEAADTVGITRSVLRKQLAGGSGDDHQVPAPMRTQATTEAPDDPAQLPRIGRGRRLTVEDRVMIQQGCAKGLSARAIAGSIGRHHSVVSREITRNGWVVTGEDGTTTRLYNAHNAGVSAAGRLPRPKKRKLDANPKLRSFVIAGVARRWSPGRISAWLDRLFPDDESMHISHEAIYAALYVQAKGSLRQELEAVMNTQQVLIRGGTKRKPRARNAGILSRKPWVEGAEITTRSPDVDDRAIPGHWEGDLIIGKGGKSALITLVERTSRYTLLGHLPDEHSSETVVETLQAMVKDLDAEQLKTITWDQGVEMAATARVKIKDGCQVFFCDPRSPWQRPTNENTNGEIRRRFYAKGTDFKAITPEHVAWVQNELNETPRQILNGATPREILHEVFKRGANTA
nr:IS30 family transposase [Corynebacterium stercoris]